MLTDKYSEFEKYLSSFIPQERIIKDELRLLTHGTDGGFYRLTPKLVVIIESEEEAVRLIKKAGELQCPLTFRASGTSLSGQSISDSVLVRISRKWDSWNISEEGAKMRMDPGLIGAFANLYLSKYHKKIGPDPASLHSAMIAGIAANNSSGMSSGVLHNIYNTMENLRLVLADGSILDGGDAESRQEFKRTHASLCEAILDIRTRLLKNETLASRIRHKYSIKNTTGYGLNSLLDFDDPVDIIEHLIIGSEGSLGFISGITVNTVDALPCRATALMTFKDTRTACLAVGPLREQRVDAAEFMDRAALRSVEDLPSIPSYIKGLEPEAAALLVEISASSPEELQEKTKNVESGLESAEMLRPVKFTTDSKEYLSLWGIRNGMFPTVCKSREAGTSAIIEDVCFPLESLADGVIGLQELFKKHGYDEAIIFGHSIDGNVHFVFSQNFQDQTEILRYRRFMEALAEMVVNVFDGSLKAEHGTGRNMAPFIEKEFGAEGYDIMKGIKRVLDPGNLLNPGVIINDDPDIYIKNLKPMPIAQELIDQCIECGFCEIYCPSKNLTLTPRQRIVAFREIRRLSQSGEDSQRLRRLKEEFGYFGDETCATDGLCALGCPVGIDTGKLTKTLRSESLTRTAEGIASFAANNMGTVTKTAEMVLGGARIAQNILGNNLMKAVSGSIRKASFNIIPQWNEAMPGPAEKLTAEEPVSGKLKMVYFPSCIARSMGLQKGSLERETQTVKIQNLINKAGYSVLYPAGMENLCCGMPFGSKGFVKESAQKSLGLCEELWEVSDEGKYPILFDTSPCLYHLKEYIEHQNDERFKKLSLYEPAEFILKYLAPNLEFHKIKESVAVHLTCSSTKMGLKEDFLKLAELCAEKVSVPEKISCCGFAGDRGFTHPELNASALKDLREFIKEEDCHEGFSNSRTCEIGLSLHSGIEYKSIAYLVDRVTTKKN